MDAELPEGCGTLSLSMTPATGRHETEKGHAELSCRETFDDLLIKCVRQYPAIYNSEMREHKDREKRQLTWRAVGRTLNTSATRSERRWRSLRDRYVKEKKKMKRLRESGVDLPKPWHHMAALSFLKGFIHHRRTSEHDLNQPPSEPSDESENDDDDGGDVDPCQNSNSGAEGASLSTTADNTSSSQPGTMSDQLPMLSCTTSYRAHKKKTEKDFLDALNSNADLLDSVQGPPMSSLQLFLLSLVERIEKLPEDLIEEFQFQTLSCIRKLRREAQDRGDF